MSKSYENQKKELIKARDAYKDSLSEDLTNLQSGLGGKGKMLLLGVAGAAVLFVFGKGVQSLVSGEKSGKKTEKGNRKEKSDKPTFLDKAQEQVGLLLLSISKKLIYDFIDRVNEDSDKKLKK